MNLSIFSDDGTLGRNDTRTVVISATATNPSYTNSDSLIRSSIIQQLQVDQIGAPAVRVSSSGYSVQIEVEVAALAQHSAETVRRLVQTSLERAVYFWGGTGAVILTGVYGALNTGLHPLLTNISTRVVSDDTRTISQTQSPWQPNPAPVYNSTNPANTRGNTSVPDVGSGFLDNLGLGVGVSTPIVLGAAALLLILIIRR